MEQAVLTHHFISFRLNPTFMGTENTPGAAGAIGIGSGIGIESAVRSTETENRDFFLLERAP
jgi:hypothetical protein